MRNAILPFSGFILMNLLKIYAEDKNQLEAFIDQAIGEFHIDDIVLRTTQPSYSAQLKIMHRQIPCDSTLKLNEPSAVFVMPDCPVDCTQIEAERNTKWFFLMPSKEKLRNCPLRLDSLVFSVVFQEDGSTALISELYAVKGGPIVDQAFVNWNQHSARPFEFTRSPEIWERRCDLNGLALTNVLMEFSPLAWVEASHGQNITKANGYFVYIVESLARTLNFT